MTISRDSMRYRLMMEGRLSNSVRRAAFDQLESLWEQRVAPTLWAQNESARSDSGLLSEAEEETRSRMRDSDLLKAKHSWICQGLDKLEADQTSARALAAEGARRGDSELPESMRKPVPQSEMARQYATMADSLWHDPHAIAAEPSRLTLTDKPAIVHESPRVRVAAPPRPSTTPTRADPLSTADIARKVLPAPFHVAEPGAQIASKTVQLRRPRS
jgi:hypothetical protein